jgi:hypothetical protein
MMKQTIGLALAVTLMSLSSVHSAGDDDITFVPPGFKPPVDRIVKVVALPAGGITLDGRPATLEQLGKLLSAARGKTVVWYYRDPNGPQTQAQRSVISVIIENKAPASLSSKPDFSDYIDQHGRSHPRRYQGPRQ